MLKLLILSSLYTSLADVIYAVNCGGEEYVDSKGTIWARDKDYEGGISVGLSESRYIRFTQDPYIYMTERQHHDDFIYSLPRLSPGKYVIILKFSEYFTIKNRRMFNIAIGSQIILTSMDVYEGIREPAAIDEFISISINEKGLYWNGLHLPDAFRSDKIILKFIKIGSDYPRVSGIVVVNGTLEDTNYSEHIQKVVRYKQLVKNKQDISDRPLQFPKDHTVLNPVTLMSVIYKYPLAIVFWTITLFMVLSKFVAY